jgi:hypothetical protein
MRGTELPGQGFGELVSKEEMSAVNVIRLIPIRAHAEVSTDAQASFARWQEANDDARLEVR